MQTLEDLRGRLARIDGRGYKAYGQIRGHYDAGPIVLFVDHVQGDPFAEPSRIRLRVAVEHAQWPADLHSNRVRRTACEDFLARATRDALNTHTSKQRQGSGKSGLLVIDAGGQEVIERSAAVVTAEWVETRLQIGLPADGRRILGAEAARLLCDVLPRVARASMLWPNIDQPAAHTFVDCIENQEYLRRRLDAARLVAFVADGAVLPRASGVSDEPLGQGVTPFRSPPELAVAFELPNPVKPPGDRDAGASHRLEGMGIPSGVTLIVGGGYHGKSTLLRALERGVYPHIPGDGREYVVSLYDAVKIRAEDNRSVEAVDIRPFINNLPNRSDTSAFSTDDASGSTSQGANIMEALEQGARLLLLDEDTSATNFMVRDARMQALVGKRSEPITPFVDRVRELYERHSVSTILVMGGCGDYFDTADRVISMDSYVPQDVSDRARAVAAAQPSRRRSETTAPLELPGPRLPQPACFDPARGRRDVHIASHDRESISYGRAELDLRYLEQLVDPSQTRAIGLAMHLAARRFMDGERSLRAVLDDLDRLFDAAGIDQLDHRRRGDEHPGRLARPRRYEIAAAINRMRGVRMRR